MTFLAERLAELRRHVDHLAAIRGRIHGPESLQSDLSLHNDVLDGTASRASRGHRR